VEAALRRHSAVRDCAVVLYAPEGQSPQLVAYIVPAEELPVAGTLRAFLRQDLPEAFIPSRFCALKELPSTSSGKTKRSALPPPDSACLPDDQPEGEAPTTAEEAVLATIWREVLALPRIGVRDNFFEWGGDSLRSLQVRARAMQLGYTFSIEQLFRHPTIRELAPLLRRETADGRGGSAPFGLVPNEIRAALPDYIEDAFPLARLQEALLFHSQNDPDYEIYLLSVTVRAAFDEGSMRGALAFMMARHPMLRMSYNLFDFDRFIQVIHRSVDPPLEVADLRELSKQEQEQRIDEWIEAERRRKFDWTVAPLFRIRIDQRSGGVFQLSVSHGLYDGWSVSTFLVELLLEYAARKAGEPSPLPPAPAVPYRDFVAAEQAAIQSTECREYWVKKLEESTASGLHYETSTRRNASGRERRRVPIPGAITSGLRILARSVRAPLKSVLLAAHLRVVSLMTGRRDAMTGLITNGRLEQPDGDRVVGLFLNTVPLGVRFGDESWRTIVRSTFRAEQELWRYRLYPLAELRAVTGKTPFDTAFNFLSFHVYDRLRARSDVAVTGWKNPSDLTYFPLCAYFTEDPVSSELLFYLDYDRTLFDPANIERMIAYYLKAIESAANEPEAPAANVCLLSAAEVAQQKAWNVSVDPDLLPSETVHRLFEQVATRQPEAVAVEFGDVVLTYGELERRANWLAARLHEMGVAAETPVGVQIDRSECMPLAFLAIAKAGGTVVPLNKVLPKERLEAIKTDCGLRFLLTDETVAAGGLGPDVAELRVDADQPADPPPARLDIPAPLNSLAYIMYTSGSTGRPKGVEIEHASLSNLLRSVGQRIAITREDTWLAVTSLSFDISLLELLLPLISGAKVVIAGSDDVRDGRRLAHLIEHAPATIMQATPSMWRLVIEAGWMGSSRLRILCGGEALSRSLANELLSRAADVINVYGPTETTIWSTYSRVEPGEDDPGIGGPLANTSLYILDDRLRPVPTGVPGELHIGGVGVARGYRNRAEQTKERFVPDPFSDRPSARMYRTGDKVRQRRDGSVEFLGRFDNQVKVRGFRVELGEIEACLKRRPDVSEAVVTVRKVADDVRLVAYVLPIPGRTPAAAELKEHLARWLPPYMVPAEFEIVPSFKLTPNGKVDRKMLPEIERAPVQAVCEIETANATEEVIVRIWKDLLEVDSVRRDDNFFDLGGHSLLVMRACARIQKELGVVVAPTLLFQYPTVAGIAAYLSADASKASANKHGDGALPRRKSARDLHTLVERRKAAWAGVPAVEPVK
jgi:amino acid adenylation domain-containing protein